MTYKDQFVAEIKVNGKILRLKNDTAYLPFGSEYTLYLKNLNSRRASVKIHIDGQDVLDGSSLVLDANSSAELKGFLKGTVATNSFRFIQKTKDIQDHRGDKIDDGLIRIEFAYEKDLSYFLNNKPFDWNYGGYFTGTTAECSCSYSPYSGSSPLKGHMRSATYSNNKVEILNELTEPQQDEGITVKGSEINQQFNETIVGDLEASQVIVIMLKGATEKKNIIKPLTIKSKLKCSTCGKHCRSSFKFCPNCATYLE
jgi:hypothetical protein